MLESICISLLIVSSLRLFLLLCFPLSYLLICHDFLKTVNTVLLFSSLLLLFHGHHCLCINNWHGQDMPRYAKPVCKLLDQSSDLSNSYPRGETPPGLSVPIAWVLYQLASCLGSFITSFLSCWGSCLVHALATGIGLHIMLSACSLWWCLNRAGCSTCSTEVFKRRYGFGVKFNPN